jgi:hypothetical protein
VKSDLGRKSAQVMSKITYYLTGLYAGNQFEQWIIFNAEQIKRINLIPL